MQYPLYPGPPRIQAHYPFRIRGLHGRFKDPDQVIFQVPDPVEKTEFTRKSRHLQKLYFVIGSEILKSGSSI